jgi:excisionase family DNA binding protein
MESLLLVKEASGLLGISTHSLYRLAKAGKIPHKRFGGSVRFSREEICQWKSSESPISRVMTLKLL